MKTIAFFLTLAILAGSALADQSPSFIDIAHGNSPPQRDAFYCQPPVWGAANASDGQASEIADDIPDELLGQQFNAVTLYISEWSALWQDPAGLAINIYYSECPPALAPDHHFEIPWSELSAELVYHQPGYMTVHSVTAVLPEVFAISEEMSIGGYALIDWGADAPFTGFCFTEYDVVYGCNEFYWDHLSFGVPRWTTFSGAGYYYSNLAYCLSLEVADVATEDTTPASGLLTSCYPNPFNPTTRIGISLSGQEHVRLNIHAADGSLVARLINGPYPAGSHEIIWDGRNWKGKPLASGAYFVHIDTGSRNETRRITLVR